MGRAWAPCGAPRVVGAGGPYNGLRSTSSNGGSQRVGRLRIGIVFAHARSCLCAGMRTVSHVLWALVSPRAKSCGLMPLIRGGYWLGTRLFQRALATKRARQPHSDRLFNPTPADVALLPLLFATLVRGVDCCTHAQCGVLHLA